MKGKDAGRNRKLKRRELEKAGKEPALDSEKKFGRQPGTLRIRWKAIRLRYGKVKLTDAWGGERDRNRWFLRQ
jgi:hypothetical protein